MTDETTTPPASPEAKALRAIDRELDVMGEALTSLAAHTETLAEMGTNDHQEQKQTLGRIEGKLDDALAFLRDFAGRIGELESWRGEHERAHVTRQ